MQNKLLSLYGLKYNPFASEVPEEALYPYPALENFCWRIENVLLREGGFALVSGDPGCGKSVALRLIASRLKPIRDVQIASITHPTARLSDFYRELGDIFGVFLNYSNRWGGFKGLRERWQSHLKNTLLRPVLFIDEAQEMPVAVLNELRMMTSVDFDSHMLLSVILAGDQRLNAHLQRAELIPLGMRMRMRLHIESFTPDHLRLCLNHMLTSAGNPHLMTDELMDTICEHSMGNYRTLCTLGNELLAQAAQQEKRQLDATLYFECFNPHSEKQKPSTHRRKP